MTAKERAKSLIDRFCTRSANTMYVDEFGNELDSIGCAIICAQEISDKVSNDQYKFWQEVLTELNRLKKP
jgi:hypothetical protein